MNQLSIAIICGGPSLERGISLNSARSIMDHLMSMNVHIKTIYVNTNLEFFSIEKGQLYSNTPSDFDFKLKNESKIFNLDLFLKDVDIVFPIIHGKYGEDGRIQAFLEEHSIPFIGSCSFSCAQMFSKSAVNECLNDNGFDVTSMIKVIKDNIDFDSIESFLQQHKKVVVKPNSSGSSIGVSIASNVIELKNAIDQIFENDIDDCIVIEEYCEGCEFTVIVMENADGIPVALIPTEIEILSPNKIFDYRKKYLPTNSTRWFCPPRFSSSMIQEIRHKAEKIFTLFNARDFIRIDGWVLKNGKIVFSDINPLSGMEQNSFLFQQAAQCGMTHQNTLEFILKNVCNRYNLQSPQVYQKNTLQNIFVLFGGNSAERQVSLMSGTNVWLKLLYSNKLHSIPCFLDQDNVWFLPYAYTLNHTVEEIKSNCENAHSIKNNIQPYIVDIRERLQLANEFSYEIPYKLSMQEFLVHVKNNGNFVFLGLHGGIGENGTIQEILEKHSIQYNGSNSSTSKVCMDKYITGQAVIDGVICLPKILCRIYNTKLVQENDSKELTYKNLCDTLKSDKFIIKPSNDGCSAGITHIQSQKDLNQYVLHISHNYTTLITSSNSIIELPENASEKQYIIEQFIEVNIIKIHNNQLIIDHKHGWIEMTVGVIEWNNNYYTLNPSVTVAENVILSLEEKFQGGTGINLTPPPEEIVSVSQLEIIKNKIKNIAKTFKLQNYARIDIFFNNITNEMILIEINTLPALTPSTVIFHQALAEKRPLYPLEFLENLCLKKFDFMI